MFKELELSRRQNRGYLAGVDLTKAKRQRNDYKTSKISGPCKRREEGALVAGLSGRDPWSFRRGLSLFSLRNSAGSRGETGTAFPLRSLQPEKVRPFLYHLIGNF